MEQDIKIKERNEDGTLKKGMVLNPKGRPKGAVNKSTKELRELIKAYVQNELENINDLLSELSPKDRLTMLCKLLQFVLPKEIEKDNEPMQEIKIEFFKTGEDGNINKIN